MSVNLFIRTDPYRKQLATGQTEVGRRKEFTLLSNILGGIVAATVVYKLSGRVTEIGLAAKRFSALSAGVATSLFMRQSSLTLIDGTNGNQQVDKKLRSSLNREQEETARFEAFLNREVAEGEGINAQLHQVLKVRYEEWQNNPSVLIDEELYDTDADRVRVVYGVLMEQFDAAIECWSRFADQSDAAGVGELLERLGGCMVVERYLENPAIFKDLPEELTADVLRSLIEIEAQERYGIQASGLSETALLRIASSARLGWDVLEHEIGSEVWIQTTASWHSVWSRAAREERFSELCEQSKRFYFTNIFPPEDRAQLRQAFAQYRPLVQSVSSNRRPGLAREVHDRFGKWYSPAASELVSADLHDCDREWLRDIYVELMASFQDLMQSWNTASEEELIKCFHRCVINEQWLLDPALIQNSSKVTWRAERAMQLEDSPSEDCAERLEGIASNTGWQGVVDYLTGYEVFRQSLAESLQAVQTAGECLDGFETTIAEFDRVKNSLRCAGLANVVDRRFKAWRDRPFAGVVLKVQAAHPEQLKVGYLRLMTSYKELMEEFTCHATASGGTLDADLWLAVTRCIDAERALLNEELFLRLPVEAGEEVFRFAKNDKLHRICRNSRNLGEEIRCLNSMVQEDGAGWDELVLKVDQGVAYHAGLQIVYNQAPFWRGWNVWQSAVDCYQHNKDYAQAGWQRNLWGQVETRRLDWHTEELWEKVPAWMQGGGEAWFGEIYGELTLNLRLFMEIWDTEVLDDAQPTPDLMQRLWSFIATEKWLQDCDLAVSATRGTWKKQLAQQVAAFNPDDYSEEQLVAVASQESWAETVAAFEQLVHAGEGGE